MNKNLLEATLNHNMKEVCERMFLPRGQFTGGRVPYEVDLNKDALDVEEFLISTDVFMNELLEFDEYTDQYNNHIMAHGVEHGTFDYMLFDELQLTGYEVKKEFGGYTYNDADYCRLDRDIHYTGFTNEEGDYYVILMVHYGADARVGFSDAVAFKIRDVDHFFMGMEVSCYLESTDEDIEWFEVEDMAQYSKELDAWIMNDTGEEVLMHTSANGY